MQKNSEDCDEPATVVLVGTGKSTEPSPDFNADGAVGFNDFVAFAQVYGAEVGDQKYDTKFGAIVKCCG